MISSCCLCLAYFPHRFKDLHIPVEPDYIAIFEFENNIEAQDSIVKCAHIVIGDLNPQLGIGWVRLTWVFISYIPKVPTEEMADLKKMLQKETLLRKAAEREVNNLKSQVAELKMSEVCSVPPIFIFSIACPFLF